MVNLTHINKTKKAYSESENSLLFLGIFQDNNLNPQQRTLDDTLDNRLSAAMKLDGFIGKKDEQIHIFGNEVNKRVVIIGLGTQNNYTSDLARSVASNITRFSTDVKNTDFSVVNICKMYHLFSKLILVYKNWFKLKGGNLSLLINFIQGI